MSDGMGDWLHELPVIWMGVVIFAGTYAMTTAIYGIVIGLAAGERARAFKAVSPGMLSPLGIIFGLSWPSWPRRCGATTIGRTPP